ncbi:TfoX/Sxy family protein [Proteobacteria bacterium 005FR1]|nr:TfoX/Sxy family protein [Proteobacteria bacterium 005FR1]
MSEFTDYLHEVFENFGTISVRRMFGGKGIFRDGLMFALVADETLYLKADEESLSYFEERELSAFEYQRRGKMVKLSYYEAPGEVLEDREQAAVWAERSYAAALRAKRPRNTSRTRTRAKRNRRG